MRPGRLALRATALATPAFLAACAVPSGGLFRGARFRDLHLYREYGDALLDGRLPYRDVFVEYPPGAVPLFAVPSLAPGGAYDALFKSLMVLCGLAAIWGVVFVLAARGVSFGRALAAALGLALAPIALGPVSLNTYDAWPAALVVLALAALVARRGNLALGLLGAAFAAKLYPIALVPLALLHLGRREAARGLAVFAAVTAVLVVPWLALAPEGVWRSIDAQLGRGLHTESLAGSVLLAADRVGAYDAQVVRSAPAVSRDVAGALPDVLGTATAVAALLAVAAVWLAYRRAGRLDLAFAAAVAGFLAFTKVLSPQYLVWLIPLVALADGVAAPLLLLAALALAQSWYFDYPELWGGGPEVWRLLARNLVIVVLYGLLFWKTSTPSSAKTSFHRGLRRRETSAAAAGIGATRSA